MGKKRQFESALTPAQKELEKYDLKALKRQVVMRGMPFEEVLQSSVLRIQGWFLEKYHNPKDESLLLDYDKWVEMLLIEGGNADLIHPAFRLSGTQTIDDKEVKVRRFNDPKIYKPKREKTSEGIFKGTKKAYTFELQQKGIERNKVVDMVLEKFPEALEKSVIIWFNKSKRLNKQ